MIKRARFLRARRAAGRERPRPTVIRVVNCASVSVTPYRAAKIYARALRKPGKYGLPDVVLSCELADVDAKAMGALAWQTFQRGPVGSPESALGISVRRSCAHLTTPGLDVGSPATREGRGIRMRPILRARIYFDRQTPHVWSRPFAVGHAPPARAPIARARYLANFARTKAFGKAGDLNIWHRWAARLLGNKRVHSVGVLHLALPRWIPQTKAARIDVGSDHPAFDVTIWPTKEHR